MVSDKPIFNNCCDEILIIESFMPKPKSEDVKESAGPKTKREEKSDPAHTRKMDRMVEDLMKKVVESFDPDAWQLVSYVGVKFHQMDKSRMIERSSYRSLGNLLSKLEADKFIQRKLNEKGHPEIRKAQ